jgi:flagellar motor component MotA
VGTHETLIVETEAAFTILGLLLVFLPMFLSVLARGESAGPAMQGPHAIIIVLAWSVPALILIAGVDATFGLLALWGHHDASKPTAILLLVLTWLIAILSVVAVKLRAT